MPLTLPGMELPHRTAGQPPRFTELHGCRAWLADNAHHPVRQQQSLLLQQLNLLNRYTLPVAPRHALLILLQAHIQQIHEACAQRYTARPLPLTPPEQAAFDLSQALWLALETGYRHCLQDRLEPSVASDEERLNLAATLFDVLFFSCLDSHAAGMTPTAAFWQRLHTTYRALEPKQPAGNSDHTMTTTTDHGHGHGHDLNAHYLQTLLLAAAHPGELDAPALARVAGWATEHAPLILLNNSPPEDLRTPPLGIDLAGDQPGFFTATPQTHPDLRWCDMAALRVSLKKTITTGPASTIALTITITNPSTLTLPGQPVPQAHEPSTEDQLLRQVYQDWCRGGRRIPGTTAQSQYACPMTIGLDAIHSHLSHPDHIGEHVRQTPQPSSPTPLAEGWQVLDETVTELRLQHPWSPGPAQSVKRLARGQLVALRTNHSEHLQLGIVRWITVSATRDALLTSLRLLPGLPQAITCAFATGAAPMHHGLLLPALSRINLPATVLIPPGEFQPGRQLSLGLNTPPAPGETPQRQTIRLLNCLERGLDFERCTFEPI